VTAWVGPGLPTFITFYPAVMVAALLAGLGPGLLATALTEWVVAYWVQPPVGGFDIAAPVGEVSLALFGGMGLLMSVVAEFYRRYRPKAAAYDQEQALRKTRQEKEFLASLLEHASQPFAVGYPDGRIGRFNHAFERLTGYTATALRGLDWSLTLTPPEWREREQQKLDELQRTGQPVRFEKEYVRKDGSRVPIELLVHLVRDAEGKLEYYYSFITDITERKQSEQALHRLNAELQAANENLVASRRAALNLMEDAVAARQLVEQASAELRREAVERKQAEQAARVALDRYWSFLEVTGQVGWTTDADGLVTEDMPAWRAFTGQSAEEIQGWGWAKALHPDDVSRTVEHWQAAVQSRTRYETEYRLRRHDGVYRDFLARGVPNLNPDGSIHEWVGTCVDSGKGADQSRAAEARGRAPDWELRLSVEPLEQENLQDHSPWSRGPRAWGFRLGETPSSTLKPSGVRPSGA
jgi:PAS domain S-box-containing protein